MLAEDVLVGGWDTAGGHKSGMKEWGVRDESERAGSGGLQMTDYIIR